jgi:hypothetical protein
MQLLSESIQRLTQRVGLATLRLIFRVIPTGVRGVEEPRLPAAHRRLLPSGEADARTGERSPFFFSYPSLEGRGWGLGCLRTTQSREILFVSFRAKAQSLCHPDRSPRSGETPVSTSCASPPGEVDAFHASGEGARIPLNTYDSPSPFRSLCVILSEVEGSPRSDAPASPFGRGRRVPTRRVRAPALRERPFS